MNNDSGFKFLLFEKQVSDSEIIQKTESEIGYPCFIKPHDDTPLIGPSLAKNVHELRLGILRTFRHADSIIVEQITNC